MTRTTLSGRPAAALIIALVASLATAPPARGQRRGEPRAVSFRTADAAELHGTFSPGKRGGRSPAVLILDDLEGDAQPQAWGRIADLLHREGYAVLRFDFRGHGRSTGVGPEFWASAWNRQMIKARPGEQIRYQDFRRDYPLTLVNDIAAAKCYLDQRHDAGECDVTKTVLLGSGGGAALGAVWLGTEWCRYRAYGGLGQRLADAPEGRDVVGALWVNLTPEVMGRGAPVPGWLRLAGGGKGVPTGLLYGLDDRAAAHLARQLQGLPGGPVHAREVAGASGTRPLLAAPDTEAAIRKYLATLTRAEEKPGAEPEPRALKDSVERRFFFVRRGRPPELAKAEGEPVPRPLSPAWLAQP